MIRSRMFRSTLSIVLLCMFVPVLVVGLTAAILTEQSSEASFHQERTQQLALLRNTCDLLLDESNFIYIQLLQDENAVRALNYDDVELPIPYEQLQQIQSFQHNLQLIAGSRPFLYSIVVYPENPYDLVISSRYGLIRLGKDPDGGWYDFYLENSRQQQYAQAREIDRVGPMLTLYISLTNNAQRRAGAMIFNYNLSEMQALLPADGTDWLVLDGEGRQLFASPGMEALDGPQRQEILGMSPGEFIYPEHIPGAVLYQVQSPAYGWRYINIAGRDILQATAQGINRVIVVVAALSLVAGVLVAVLLTRASVRPITRILDMIRQMDEGKGLPPKEEAPQDEYEIISYNLLSSHLAHQQLDEELAQRKLRLRDAEMVALQAQINPHFMYNTMEIINWRAIRALGDTNEISHMITTLSTQLRYALERPDELTPLAREITHGEQYAQLMTYRLGDIFHIEWDIAEELQQMLVPKLILQPLIENAIQHGIQQLEGGGIVTVKAEIAGGSIALSVADNGAGMSRSTQAMLREQLQTFDGLQYAHIGLMNVYQRVRFVTFDRARMTIDSEEGKGTRICLILPVNNDVKQGGPHEDIP